LKAELKRVTEERDILKKLRCTLPRRPGIRTYECWLYLAVVLDLFSRQVIGWSMSSRIDREVAMNALLMTVWRWQPKNTVIHTALKR
jgi:transposase InsO family protein